MLVIVTLEADSLLVTLEADSLLVTITILVLPHV